MNGDAGIPQVLAVLGINFKPAVQATEEFQRKLQSLTEQLQDVQRQMQTTVQTITKQMSKPAQQITQQEEAFGKLRQRVRDYYLQQEEANFRRHLADLEKRQQLSNKQRLALEAQYFTKAELEARQFMNRYMRGWNEFGDMLDRRISWFVAGIAFYGLQDVFRQMLNQMGQIEMGMIQISRISEDATADFNQMRTALLDLGVQYGFTWQTVQDIALRWAQAGYNVTETLKLTEASLLALNTAELNATQAWAA